MTTKHIFVDGSHLLMRLRHMNHARKRDGASPYQLNYAGVLDQILGVDATLGSDSTLFLAVPPRNQLGYMSDNDEQLFVERGFAIERYPLRSRRVDCFECGHDFTIYQEKMLDAAVVTAMFMSAVVAKPGEDVVVLVSGDGDFYPALNSIANELGVAVEVYGFRNRTSTDLLDPVFNFEDIYHHLSSPRRTTRAVRRPRQRPWPRTKM